MICVPISEVLPKGMTMGPNFEIFWTLSKFDTSKKKIKISLEKKSLVINGSINKFPEFQNFEANLILH